MCSVQICRMRALDPQVVSKHAVPRGVDGAHVRLRGPPAPVQRVHGTCCVQGCGAPLYERFICATGDAPICVTCALNGHGASAAVLHARSRRVGAGSHAAGSVHAKAGPYGGAGAGAGPHGQVDNGAEDEDDDEEDALRMSAPEPIVALRADHGRPEPDVGRDAELMRDDSAADARERERADAAQAAAERLVLAGARGGGARILQSVDAGAAWIDRACESCRAWPLCAVGFKVRELSEQHADQWLCLRCWLDRGDDAQLLFADQVAHVRRTASDVVSTPPAAPPARPSSSATSAPMTAIVHAAHATKLTASPAGPAASSPVPTACPPIPTSPAGPAASSPVPTARPPVPTASPPVPTATPTPTPSPIPSPAPSQSPASAPAAMAAIATADVALGKRSAPAPPLSAARERERGAVAPLSVAEAAAVAIAAPAAAPLLLATCELPPGFRRWRVKADASATPKAKAARLNTASPAVAEPDKSAVVVNRKSAVLVEWSARVAALANRLHAALASDVGETRAGEDASLAQALCTAVAAYRFGQSTDQLRRALRVFSANIVARPACEWHLWSGARSPARLLTTEATLPMPLVARTRVLVGPTDAARPLWDGVSPADRALRPDVVLVGSWSADRVAGACATTVCECLPPKAVRLPVDRRMPSDWMRVAAETLRVAWRRLNLCAIANVQRELGVLRILLLDLGAMPRARRVGWDQATAVTPMVYEHEAKARLAAAHQWVRSAWVDAGSKSPVVGADVSAEVMRDAHGPVEWIVAREHTAMLCLDAGHALSEVLQPYPWGMYAFQYDPPAMSVAVDATSEVDGDREAVGAKSERCFVPYQFVRSFVPRLLERIVGRRLAGQGADDHGAGPSLAARVLGAFGAGSSRGGERNTIVNVVRHALGRAYFHVRPRGPKGHESRDDAGDDDDADDGSASDSDGDLPTARLAALAMLDHAAAYVESPESTPSTRLVARRETRKERRLAERARATANGATRTSASSSSSDDAPRRTVAAAMADALRVGGPTAPARYTLTDACELDLHSALARAASLPPPMWVVVDRDERGPFGLLASASEGRAPTSNLSGHLLQWDGSVWHSVGPYNATPTAVAARASEHGPAGL